MKILWAPWRIKYILGKKERCIFCDKLRENKDKENYVLLRGKNGFVMLNTFPYNNGHLMVAPYRHVPDLEGLEKDVLAELMGLVKTSTQILKRALKPEGFNIGINLGKVAGAGVEGHIHIHIVPRWGGDTSFISTVGDTKIIPESLDDTYKKLLAAL
ncbi:HIT domain-containing protein [bacterium]|nr:HIT domain-containing protein [bacterium]NIN93355.1 HIT domain-containing protein [bacterium]NIO19138.1 HIT domain-containing protein [bacterium]NIO74272.1 HIT domain-containing protein [bacterium]